MRSTFDVNITVGEKNVQSIVSDNFIPELFAPVVVSDNTCLKSSGNNCHRHSLVVPTRNGKFDKRKTTKKSLHDKYS